MYPRSILLSLAFILPTLALADYAATGVIKGNVCTGFFVEFCRMVPILAVKGDDGRLYTMTTRYSKVDEYNAKTRRCWISTKARGAGLWSSAANLAFQPDFYTRNEDGEYEEVDVEYLTFECVKV